MRKVDTDFAGKNVIVTGGSSGIGKAAAQLFAEEGANVFIFARDQEKLDRALQEIESGQSVRDQRFGAFSVNVTNYEEVESAIASIVETSGAPDILINSAGIVRPGYFWELPLDDFRQQMETNYFGTLYATRAVVPHMKAQRSGHVVNISSIAGVIGVYGYTAYSASKFAVLGFSEALRVEMKPHNISVSVVIPNDTDTPQLQQEREQQPLETKITEGLVKPKNLSRPREYLAHWLVKLVNDSGSPLDPEEVAEAIVKGIRRKRYLIVPDPVFRIAYRLRGLVIPLAQWAFDHLVEAASRDEEGG